MDRPYHQQDDGISDADFYNTEPEHLDLEPIEPDQPDDIPEVPENPTALPSGFSGKSGVTPQALALPDGEGSIQGMGESFTPNLNTGSGSFSVPVALPPGRRGLQPSLGLGYTTGAGDGPLGWGWGMGVPFISRQSDKGLPRYDATDRFMYNGGQELVPIARSPGAMPDGEDWPEHVWDPAADDIVYYRSRIEGSFMRFFFNRDRDEWLVQDRQGNHTFLGETSDEKEVGPSGTVQWNISRMTDVRNALGDGGNDVHYRFLVDGRTSYIEDIYWNSFEQDYGDLATYQHNVHFVYEMRPDATVTFASGFRQEQNLRLARIEVSSFQYAPSQGGRQLTRVYLFTYDDENTSFHSRLIRIQTCGRDWSGPGTGTCMPPLELYYSEIPGLDPSGTAESQPIPGFGRLNEQTRELGVSPDVSVDDANVDLMDVNQDGLPDLLITMPDYGGFGSDHAAILNDGHGNLDPTPQESGGGLVRIDNPAGWSLNLQNLNVSVLDMDGSGNADLLHMPYAEQYHYYRMTDHGCPGGAAYCWDETDPIALNDGIDFTNDADDIRLVDINNDHLVDVVRTTGTRMEHFVNLSAYPGYQGQFGSVDASGTPQPNESIDTCILMHGGMIQFNDGAVQLGDMNGDGLQDIVHLKDGAIAYWPNRGWGRWGDTDEECSEGEYVDGTEIEMEGSPWFSNPDEEGVLIADVNGDGLSDLVQIRFDAVDIWLNKNGLTFTDRHIIEDTPYTNSGFYGKVRLADINGSGTVDLVWADAGGYSYLDLGGYYDQLEGNGGLPAGLLERVESSLGGTTWIDYATTTELMIEARDFGEPWETVMPMPMTVVKRVVGSDNLDLLGDERGVYAQEFDYRNPYYDPREAEFKGFGYAESWDTDRAHGLASCDADSVARGEAPLVARNWYHRGVRPECMELPVGVDVAEWPTTWGPHSPECADALHTDNPLLGLTGASLMSDVYSPCTGQVISSTLSELEIRRLFLAPSDAQNTTDLTGVSDPFDDRNVYLITPNQGRIYKYDPSTTGGAEATPEEYPWVTINDASAGGDVVPLVPFPARSFTPRAPDGTFHRVDGYTLTDNRGYPTEAHYFGFHKYSGAALYEHARCDGYSEYYTVSFDSGTWVHMADESYTYGPGPANGGDSTCPNRCKDDIKCNWIDKEYNAYGDLNQSVVHWWDYEGSADTAEHTLVASRKVYNDFGQVTHDYAGCLGDDLTSCQRHTENVYTDEDDGDLHYSSYIRQEVAYVPDGAVTEFRTKARWDAGRAQVVQMVSADGSKAAVEIDALGRLVRAYGPNPMTGELCPSPHKEVFYHYGSSEEPMSMLESWINTSNGICGNDRWEVMYTFIDALGRAYAQIAPGDKGRPDSAYPWLINGHTQLNSKGMAISSCEGGPVSSPTMDPAEVVSLVGGWNQLCSQQQFDLFGRPTLSIAPDGTKSLAEYEVDQGHSWDHFDLFDPDNQGTYSSQRVDGLGRTVESITRHNEGGTGERRVIIKYGGSSTVVTRLGEDEVPVSRRVLHDTAGRMRVNLDPNFGRWEYAYDQIGQLVQTINPMGNVAEFTYDRAGRLLFEVYDGDVESEYFYDVYPGDTVLGLDENPYWGGYPAYAITIGSLVAVKDRSGVALAAADRGIRSESWKMVYPDDRLYHFETLTDGGGELIYAEDPDGHRSTVDYYADGTVKSTYWTDNPTNEHKYPIVLESKANYLGQTELVRYGDGAQTEVWTGYEPVTHRPLATVAQQRGGTAAGTTVMALGYQYNQLGMLTGIADWRGRADGTGAGAGLPGEFSVSHPTEVSSGLTTGTHFASFPGEFDESMMAPALPVTPNQLDPLTLWPKGSLPSDASFGYDTLYQLVSEDREFVSFGGDGDGPTDENGDRLDKRLEAVDWAFDPLGSMAGWTEDASMPGSDSLGRALGSRIVNGYQLNVAADNGCMDALSSGPTLDPTCYKPDALYFATNVDDGVGVGRGTCVWVKYDTAGRMTRQIIRTGCSTCEFEDADDLDHLLSSDYRDANCPGADEQGTPADGDFLPEVAAEAIDYQYSWNAVGQLSGAQRWGGPDGGAYELTMSYYYDASGARVVRQKSDVAGSATNIKQDLYISGGYERRQVELQDDLGSPVSVDTLSPGQGIYHDVEGTRLVKYASGARIQYKVPEGDIFFESEPQVFLNFTNHLGSTTAVVDYSDGTLVEYTTNYAYGADESRWKNPDTKYDNADEPYGFTGKEEDTDVGLHYFGARYYSSYLGRWISPDPPVIHGSASGANFYNYGANSPYIYVDPDGNWVQILVAAIIGSVVGSTTEAIKRGGIKSWGDAGAILYAGVKGGAIGASSGAGGPWAGAAASTAFVQVETAWAQGGTSRAAVIGAAVVGMAMGSFEMASGGAITAAVATNATNTEFHKQSGITFGTSLASSYAGTAAGKVGGTGLQLASSWAHGTSLSLANQAMWTDEGLTSENFDDVILESTKDWAIGQAGSVIGGEIAAAGSSPGSNSVSDAKSAAGNEPATLDPNPYSAPEIPENPYHGTGPIPESAKAKLSRGFDAVQSGDLDTPNNQASEYSQGLDFETALDTANVVTGNDVPVVIRMYWKIVEAFTGFKTGATTIGNNIYWNNGANQGYDLTDPGHLSLLGHEVVHVAQSQAHGGSYVGSWIRDFSRTLFTGKATPAYGSFDLSPNPQMGGRGVNAYYLTRWEQQAYGIQDAMWNGRSALGW